MRRRLLTGLAAAATAAAVAVPAATAAPQGRSLVLYAKPTRAQFVDHNDDRKRGDIINPFEADTLPTPPSANSGKAGARAGDKALFSFKVYADAALKRPVGTATYACTFNFAQEAICTADFALTGGSMVAMGPAILGGLTGQRIVLPVTGGTGRYAGAHGQLTSTPSASKKSNTQVIRFQLV